MFEIIRDTRDLEGTCYIEIQPGLRSGQHWQEGSLFFEEEDFGYLAGIIEEFEPAYDPYGFLEIEEAKWKSILTAFDELATDLENSIHPDDLTRKPVFVFGGTAERFFSHYQENKLGLAKMIREFSEWLRKELQTHSHISVLGI